jgi:riboflavin synthase
MFSGIVECMGKITTIDKTKDYYQIEVSFPSGFNEHLKKGASIAVDGVCLTSKDNGHSQLKFDVIPETINKTRFSQLEVGDAVNLERSISASSEIGGHLMSGHIQCIGAVKDINDKGEIKDIQIEIPSPFSKYIIEKGYIGVNGCSLTIGGVNDNCFYVHLIPETLQITNISKLKIGSMVNIEIDQNTIAIVDTVNNFLLAQKSS